MKLTLLTLLLLGLDQGSKYYFRNVFSGPVEILPDVGFQLAYNTGIAFSLPVGTWVTIPLTLVVIGLLLWQLWKSSLSGLTRFALCLILTGAIGNLIDRVLFAAVTDFISIYSFPIFNLADSFVTLGVVLFLWHEIIGSES